MARAKPLGLLDELDVIVGGEETANLLCALAHDDDRTLGASRTSGTNDPPDQWLIKELVHAYRIEQSRTETVRPRPNSQQGHLHPGDFYANASHRCPLRLPRGISTHT